MCVLWCALRWLDLVYLLVQLEKSHLCTLFLDSSSSRSRSSCCTLGSCFGGDPLNNPPVVPCWSRTTVCGGRVMSLMTAACACCTAAAAAGWSLLTMWICLAAFLGWSGTATNDFLLMLFMVSSDASLSDSSSSESVEKRLVGKRMVPTLVLPGEEEEEEDP